MRIQRLLNCRPEERKRLEISLDRIRLLADHALPEIGLGHLGLAISERLEGARSVTITCRDSKDSTTLVVLKGKDGSKIELMRPAFELGEEQFTALLFRVFVTICGGTALDAAALDHHCMPGASPMPSPAGFALFDRCPVLGRFRAGHFVLWDPRTGELFARRADQNGPGEQLASVMRLRQYPDPGARSWPPPPVNRASAGEPSGEPDASDCCDSGPEDFAPGAPPPPNPSPAQGAPPPPEGGELLRELTNLGPHTPQEWSRIMDRLTRRLLKRIADGKEHHR